MIINHLQPDIISLNETHLTGEASINLDGYVWYGNNREKHVKAPRGSGGVGICVKCDLLRLYKVKIITKEVDGILGLQFISLSSPYCFVIFTCYLPPETSPWGRDASVFFGHLLSYMYTYADVDATYVCGDVNGRIGNWEDYVKEIDDVPLRVVLDEGVNKHGESLIEFLKDSKMCIINGRICPLNDNYTSVSMKGKAVVDYIATPYECLKTCTLFKVITANQMIESIGCMDLIGERSKVPDHSLLILGFTVGYGTKTNLTRERDQQVKQCKKGVSRKLPIDFLCSNMRCKALADLVDRQQVCFTTQDMLDSWYGDLCELVHDEMGGQERPSKANRSKHSKPYWNKELQDLWYTMHSAERLFVKHKGDRESRQQLLDNFRQCQHAFDKRYRLFKRKYQRGQLLYLEEIQSSSPQHFWSEVNKLGPKRKKQIPMEIWGEGENLIRETSQVLSKWETDFATLFENDATGFDDDFFLEMCQLKSDWENKMSEVTFQGNRDLNKEISMLEVLKVIDKAKIGKATGIEDLPNEILKSPKLGQILFNLLFNCFHCSKIPTVWFKSIISPIPKSQKNDPRIPLNYRGISLMSTVYKLYSSLLNERLMEFLEKEHLLVEEQNGFRKARACIDHIYTVCTIVRNRLKINKSTYACFIDFQKAFDFVNRDLLALRLIKTGVDGKFYQAVMSLYSAPQACVKVNDAYTNWFPTPSGVKQGDALSPTLFAVFINDLANQIKPLNCGVKCGSEQVSILLYADDIILIAETESDLQNMLSCASNWCKKWRLTVNEKKTEIMHFRNPAMRKSEFEFHFGTSKLNYTNCYKYLGFYLDEHMHFIKGTTVLTESANRALGGVIAKTKNLRDIGFSTYSKLYQACVCPVIDYVAGVWGFKHYAKSESVHNRAMRYFLGVHKFTPTLAIMGDMGWEPNEVRWSVHMVRLWNRILGLNPNRIVRKIFEWDILIKGAWATDMYDTLSRAGYEDHYHNKN